MNLGNKLKVFRIAKKLEPIIIADKLGISESTYRRYERNESAPDFNMLQKIANTFEIELGDFLKDDSYLFYNQSNKGDTNIGDVVIHQLSEKLIQQYEDRIIELKQTIIELKSKLQK